MNIVVYTENRKLFNINANNDVFQKLGTIFLKNPIVIDGFGERSAIFKCNSCRKDMFLSISEVIIIKFKDHYGNDRQASFSGETSYNIQNELYGLDYKECGCIEDEV
jgi:hypothetical protein